MFKGSITALITPFKDGEIDWPAFENFIEWQIDQGAHGLVPCGTTGESPTLTHDEHMAIVKRCVDVVKGRIPVIAGTGSNSTREAIKLTKHAKEVNADAALIVGPYYNKPMQEGIYEHYKAIHDEVSMPIILYNVPGRSVVDIDVETVARLAKLTNIVGIKDATGDLERPVSTRLEVGDDFCQLSGCDEMNAAFYAQGGHGCISVVANIAPKLSSDMYKAWVNKDIETFGKIRDLLGPLSLALFCESSPAPTKYAASTFGFCTGQVRSPILTATSSAQKIVDAAMKHAGLSSESEVHSLQANG
ncbi:MAG: 4-hydroxy-tetrahydrodipicolinate synthase [Alphaproteobacteria bacterium]|nr:4-hydroxy-tetrahydrodipicolinate synthase [Alphaproteobacteria bacterium]